MQAPSAAQLVGMWERGARQPWVDRALTLVSACHPELTDSELRALAVGERDADLLALRERDLRARAQKLRRVSALPGAIRILRRRQ